MRKPIKQSQDQALDFIEIYLKKHNTPPTYKSIGEALGVSDRRAFQIVKPLIDSGDIEVSPVSWKVTRT